MRIIFVTLFFPPNRTAGTENYTHGLASTLQARGHDVSVVCAEDWESGSMYWNGVTQGIYDGVPVSRIHLNWTKADNPNRILYDSPDVERWFSDYLAETNPGVVHVTSAATLGIGTLRAVRRAGIPLLLTLMDFWFLCPKTVLLADKQRLCNGQTTAWECQQCLLSGSGMFRQSHSLLSNGTQMRFWRNAGNSSSLARVRGFRGMALNMDERKALMVEMLNAPDVILSHSKFVQHMFAQAGLGGPIKHVPNGHDLSWLEQYHGRATSGMLRIGYMGQVTEIKGVHVLVEAFQDASLAGKARLDIWGDLTHSPDYVRRLRTIVADDRDISLRGRFRPYTTRSGYGRNRYLGRAFSLV